MREISYSRFNPIQHYVIFSSNEDFVSFQKANPKFTIISVSQLVGYGARDVLVVYHKNVD